MEYQKQSNTEQGGNLSQNDLKEIFEIHYNDLFSKLLQKSGEEFISLLKRQIILHLRIIDKQCDSSLLTNFYEKYQNISKRAKVKIVKIFKELKSNLEKNLIYLNVFDIYIHCSQCKEAIHKCGNQLIIFENYFFCIKCKKVYNCNHIKLFCKECNKSYLTQKRSSLERKNNYFYSTSYLKYHCFTENEEKIKCLNCGQDLYYNIKINSKSKVEKGIKDIFCINCKLIFDTKEIFFTCKICGENFKAEAQIYRNFPTIKKYLLLLVHTFRKNIYALPDIIINKKCNCDLNGVQYFLHKDNGRLYEGNKDGKSVIICDHCYGIFKNENFNWNCPLCGGSFKAVKKYINKKYDKNKKKISATNTNIKMLNLNKEEKYKILRKTNSKEKYNQNITNHILYNSIVYSNEKNNNFNHESSKKLKRDFSLTNQRKKHDSREKANCYNNDKGLIIKEFGNKKNNTSIKKNIENEVCGDKKISLKYKHIKPARLFKNIENENELKKDEINENTCEKKENENSMSNLNKNKNISNRNENSSYKKREISTLQKTIISETKPLFKIKESLCEESLENTSSEKKDYSKLKNSIKNVIPNNLFLKNKNNNCNNNNISISINNNVIQLSYSPNIKTDNNIQKSKKKSKIMNKKPSPEIKILNNSSSSKILIGENYEKNILINNSKEKFKKKKIITNNEKIVVTEEKEENENLKKVNDLEILQNRSFMNKEKEIKKIINIKYKGQNLKKEQNNNNLIKEENIKIMRNEVNNNIKNKDINEINNINSEKKSNIVTRLSLIKPDDKYPQSNQIKKVNKIKIKKISDSQINKSKNFKIINTIKNSNPNVFIITNLSKNNLPNIENNNDCNMSVNDTKKEKIKERYLNIKTNDNSNFVYVIPKSIINKKVINNNKNKKENEVIENSPKNNSEINQNTFFNICENNNFEIKKEKCVHKKNNLSFHINNINEIKNMSSIKKDIITINNKKKKMIIQNNINSPVNVKTNNNKKKIVKKKNNIQINNINTNNNLSNNINDRLSNIIKSQENNKKIKDKEIMQNGENINKKNNQINNKNLIIKDNNKILNVNLNNNIMNHENINNINSNNLFLKLKIYFYSFGQEIANKLSHRLSFDVGMPTNPFTLLSNSESFEIKTFDSNYYTILREIGKGSYGKIYLVEDPQTKEQFALKKILIGNSLELKDNQEEFKLTWRLTKSNPELKIVKKYAIEIKKLDKYNLVMYVLMEVANCDWEQELINRQKDNAFYSEIELIEILKSLVHTLAELQKRGISHRDVKPQNILCFGKEGYKLSDFGEAKSKKRNFMKNNNYNYEVNTTKQTIRGTELYMSPILFKALQMNCVNGAQYNAYKSDVFSLGMCFLLASSLNYQSLYDIREIYDMKVIKEIIQKYLKNYSDNYVNFIVNMLQINEKLRPDFIELNSMII